MTLESIIKERIFLDSLTNLDFGCDKALLSIKKNPSTSTRKTRKNDYGHITGYDYRF